MEEKCLIKVEIIWLLVQLLLVFTTKAEVRIMYCPVTCTCVMDDILGDNSAACTFGNSTANVTWTKVTRYITLKLECADAVDNYQYDCNDWPRFNISGNYGRFFISGCAPSVIRCAHEIFTPVSNITRITTRYMAGTFTAEDLINFNHDVLEVEIYLRDKDTDNLATVPNCLSALKYFYIRGGKLRLGSNEFRYSKMKYLNLHRNKIRSFPSDTFNGLSNLQMLYSHSNYLEHLGANTFRGLNNITTLIIQNDTLSSIDPNAFSSMKQLTDLQFRNNRLKTIPNGLLTGLDRLQHVLITMNQVELKLDTHAFANLAPSITIVDISTNKVKYLPKHVFNGSIYMRELILFQNNIRSLSPKIFATTTGLTRLVLSENKIQSLPDDLFSEMKNLMHIFLSDNYISTLKGDIFTHSSELKVVDLSNNRLTHMDRDIFRGTSLTKLNLMSNKLQRINSNTTLDWQTKELNLTNNELVTFENWFVELVGLEHLDLLGNKIMEIRESQIYRFNANVTINLSNNIITKVIRDSADLLVNITPGAVSLYLSNNPLQCDCLVTTLLKEWHNYEILADYENITCDKEGKISNLDVYVQCNKTHALVALVGSSVVGTLALFVILLSINTRRRKIWKYARSLFETNYPEGIFKKDYCADEIFEIEEKDKLYDLFISFAHQDADIVTDKLLPILENDFNLKVCVHYRDWVVGDLIPVQIKQSVETSTMTMIILTEHFLESEWSDLEFRTAHELSIEEGNSKVILVLIDESIIRHDKLRSELKAYIDMNTYLVWDDTFFWDKLQKILSKCGKLKNTFFNAKAFPRNK